MIASLLIVVILATYLLQSADALCTALRASSLSRSITQLRDTPLKVQGNEGLLDPNRMNRAMVGSGIKVPEGKRLKVGVIGGGLAGMITGQLACMLLCIQITYYVFFASVIIYLCI